MSASPEPPTAPPLPSTRAGFVALIGPPNSGKSTLLNAFLGTKLSIVTPKAQTTWRRVTGIHTEAGVQLVFVDTPGLLGARDLLQHALLEEAHEAIADADVLLLVLDAARGLSGARTETVEAALGAARGPVFVALNKVDEASPERVGPLEAWAGGLSDQARIHRISALHGAGVDGLLAELSAAVPPSPFYYPEDDLATASVRFFVAELVRETVFEQFEDEIPYSVFCRVEEFREDQEPLYVKAELYVERTSQKGIVIGSKGRAIRELGTSARRKIEHFLGRSVYLDLWVKVLPGWRRKHALLSRWGFRPPRGDGAKDENR